MQLNITTPIIFFADDYHDFDYIQSILMDATGCIDLTYIEGEELVDGQYVACFYVNEEDLRTTAVNMLLGLYEEEGM